MKKYTRKILTPNNVSGEVINDLWEEGLDFDRLIHIGGKRTHKLGLYMATGDINLKQALAAAYLQGITDIAISSTSD